MIKKEFIVSKESENLRVDQFVTVKLNSLTRSQVQSICDNAGVLVNNKKVAKSYRVLTEDIVTVFMETEKPIEILPEKVSLPIYYQDKYLAVVEKPKGMITHPTEQITTGTLVNALLYNFDTLSDEGGELRRGIVHRLDKDTSGLLIIALDNDTHEKLKNLMMNHEITRKYQGIVYGRPKEDSGIIETHIGRHPVKRTCMAVVEEGRYSKTFYKTLHRYSNFSHMEFQLYTGRTHQIRVHMAHIGHPLAGDAVYGPRRVIKQLEGQCLHSNYLKFIHPITGEDIEIESPLPDYFTKFIHKIK